MYSKPAKLRSTADPSLLSQAIRATVHVRNTCCVSNAMQLTLLICACHPCSRGHAGHAEQIWHPASKFQWSPWIGTSPLRWVPWNVGWTAAFVILLDKPLFNKWSPVWLVHLSPPGAVVPKQIRLSWKNGHQVCLMVFLQNLVIKQTYLLYTFCSLTVTWGQMRIDHLEVIPIHTNRRKIRWFVVRQGS